MAELVNFMEEIVFRQLEKMLAEKEDICTCERCRLDMAALALNELPPRYVATDRGKVFAKVAELESQFGTDVLLALLRAMERVGKNPRHQ